MTITINKWIIGGAVALTLLGISLFFPRTSTAQNTDNLTPGMLFGPVYVTDGQHLELCASFLGEGTLKAVVHFRNLDTGEVTQNEELTFAGGAGACASYIGTGHIVGLARGDGAASEWVSPTNALISTMAIVNNEGGTVASMLGVPKIWVRGF